VRVWVFFPPLHRISGGARVLLQVAQRLHELQSLGGVLFWEQQPHAGPADLPWVSVHQADLSSQDVLLIPEGWPNALALGIRCGCRVAVYCQNWAYLFHGLQEGVRWQDLPVSFVAVSHPVACFVEQVLGRWPAVVRAALDTRLWHPPQAKPQGPLRIACMPRKNKAVIEGVRRVVAERGRIGAPLEWVFLQGLEPQAVAEALGTCHVFLASGFPEGLGLPPLEAMACGCLVVGCAGLGGWDYMRPASQVPGWLCLREVPWHRNGWWVADGDILGLALGLEAAVAAWQRGARGAVAAEAAKTVAAYSFLAQRQEVAAWLATL
jgi:glycosyltransferase involved in cell wall biosynthesis